MSAVISLSSTGMRQLTRREVVMIFLTVQAGCLSFRSAVRTQRALVSLVNRSLLQKPCSRSVTNACAVSTMDGDMPSGFIIFSRRVTSHPFIRGRLMSIRIRSGIRAASSGLARRHEQR